MVNITRASKPASNATLANLTPSPAHAAAPPPPPAVAHVIFGMSYHAAFGLLVVLAGVGLLVASTIRGHVKGGRKGALEALSVGLRFFILPVIWIDSYVYRWEAALGFLAAINGIVRAWAWFVQFPPFWRWMLVGALFVALAQFAFLECYLFAYRYLYREKYPDLCFRTEGSSTLRYQGRLYRSKANPNGGYDIRFAKLRGGLLQRWKGLHVLHAQNAPARGPSRRIFVLVGGALVADMKNPKLWTLTDEPMPDHPLHTDSSQHVIARVLTDSSRISKEASEGNVHYIARRIMDDPTSSVSVDSWRNLPGGPAAVGSQPPPGELGDGHVGGAGAPPPPPQGGGASPPESAPITEFRLVPDEPAPPPPSNGGGKKRAIAAHPKKGPAGAKPDGGSPS